MFQYPKHVHFECEKCGLCCSDTSYKSRNILLLDHEITRISEETLKAVEEFAEPAEAEGPFTHRMKKQSGRCVFLRENLCSIYEARPIICRFYPFSLKSFDENMYIFSSTKECLGIGKGPLLQQEYFRQLFGEFQKTMNEKRV